MIYHTRLGLMKQMCLIKAGQVGPLLGTATTASRQMEANWHSINATGAFQSVNNPILADPTGKSNDLP